MESLSFRETSTKQLPQVVRIEEEKIEDIPQHYLDPITAQIMKHPVVTPSGFTVDRSTS